MNEQELNQKVEEIKNASRQAGSLLEELKQIKDEAKEQRSQAKRWNTNAKTHHDRAKNLSNKADQIAEKISQKQNEVEQKAGEIAEYYSEFRNQRSALEDSEEGMKALFAEVKDIHKKINETYDKADDVRVEVARTLEKVEEIRDEAEEYKNETERNASKSTELKNNIKDHLELISASTLRSVFKKRERMLVLGMVLWALVTIVGLILLGLFYADIFDVLANSGTFSPEQVTKIVFSIPLALGLIWSAKNYSRERRLVEKYGFKAVISTALKNYIELLKEEFPEEKGKVARLEFTLDNLEKLFDEPYDDNEDSEIELSLWNKFKAKWKEVSSGQARDTSEQTSEG